MVKTLEIFGNYIDGKIDKDGEETTLLSPIDGSEFGKLYLADEEKTKAAIDSAESAFRKWSMTTLNQRQDILSKLLSIVEEKADRYAWLESANTGRTLRQSTFMDVTIAIEHIRYFATTTEFVESRTIEHPEYPGTKGIVQYRPFGVVGGVAPWNVPLLMAVWKIMPALLTGNTVVLKPSHFTPATAFELAKDLSAAGLPPGVLNVVTGEGSVVGTTLSRSEKIKVLSFTGSTATGKRVSREAGGTLKKILMELGGKSPNIVLSDADLDKAAEGVLFGIFLHSGQLCESGSRLLVHDDIKERLLSRIKFYMERMKPGNPLDMETDIGAITTREQRRKIEELYNRGLEEGAKLFFSHNLGTGVPEGGFYFPPTVFSDVSSTMDIAQEEIFGPVLTVTNFHSDGEAADIANGSKYGLAAGIWSNSTSRATGLANRIDSGTVWINDYHMISAAAPRGGYKESGIGRELGLDGIMEYTQTRHLFYGSDENALGEIARGLVVSDHD